MNPDPAEDTKKEAFKGILDILGIAINPESALGDENISARKTAMFPDYFRVNRVTIDQKLEFDNLTSQGLVVGTMTTIYTTIDYQWGQPQPVVEVINIEQATVYKKVNPPVTKRNLIPRAKAESMPLIVPPKA